MNNIKEFIEQHPDLVRVRPSQKHPGLFVVKYHNRVFYKNLWTRELQEMRGLVVDQDWNIVVHPFTKVFNRFERGVDMPLDTTVEAVHKINGFLGVMTNSSKWGRLYSTTGSLDSDYAVLVENWLGNIQTVPQNISWMFEIVDPSDPHIIPEQPGAYLIGARDLITGNMMTQAELDQHAGNMGAKRPHHFVAKFGEVVEQCAQCQHEGFLVSGPGVELKLKSPYYLTKKLFARLSEKKLTGSEFWQKDPKQTLPEEYYSLVDHIQQNQQQFAALDEQQRLTYIRDFLNNENSISV